MAGAAFRFCFVNAFAAGAGVSTGSSNLDLEAGRPICLTGKDPFIIGFRGVPYIFEIKSLRKVFAILR